VQFGFQIISDAGTERFTTTSFAFSPD